MVGTAIVVVIHTTPEARPETGYEIGRIISARKATGSERHNYEEGKY